MPYLDYGQASFFGTALRRLSPTGRSNAARCTKTRSASACASSPHTAGACTGCPEMLVKENLAEQCHGEGLWQTISGTVRASPLESGSPLSIVDENPGLRLEP